MNHRRTFAPSQQISTVEAPMIIIHHFLLSQYAIVDWEHFLRSFKLSIDSSRKSRTGVAKESL